MSSESELQRLINLFAQAEEVIEKEILRAEAREAEYTAAQRRARKAEISQILASLQELAIGGKPEEPTGPLWNMVRDAYREGSDAAIKDLEGLKQPTVSRGFNQLHQDAAEVVYENLRNRMTDAVGYVGRRVDDVFRKATLREVMAAQITGRATGETAKGIEEDLAGRGIRAFQDSRGREWKLSTYAEMAAKTTKTEATTMGNLNRIAGNGIDLVQVIEHPDSCEICKPFEGKVYSISGDNERYPPLREAPPYHPNCSHIVAAFIEGLSEEPPGIRMAGGGGGGRASGGRSGEGGGDEEFVDPRTAVVPDRKMIYSLSDPDKGRVFRSFGFSPSRPEELRRAILDNIEGVPLVEREGNEFGRSYRSDFDVEAPNGRTVPLQVGWFKRNQEDFFREVTAFIDTGELGRRERGRVE